MENVRSVVVVLWNGEEDTAVFGDAQITHDVALPIMANKKEVHRTLRHTSILDVFPFQSQSVEVIS